MCNKFEYNRWYSTAEYLPENFEGVFDGDCKLSRHMVLHILDNYNNACIDVGFRIKTKNYGTSWTTKQYHGEDFKVTHFMVLQYPLE